MRRFVIPAGLALSAAVLVPLAFLGTEVSAPAADHLDPPARTNPNSDATPDFAADIADLYVTHNDEVIVMTVTFGGPASPELPAFYDDELRFTISVSNAPPRTTTDTVVARTRRERETSTYGIMKIWRFCAPSEFPQRPHQLCS